jgi:hypothetical protein
MNTDSGKVIPEKSLTPPDTLLLIILFFILTEPAVSASTVLSDYRNRRPFPQELPEPEKRGFFVTRIKPVPRVDEEKNGDGKLKTYRYITENRM